MTSMLDRSEARPDDVRPASRHSRPGWRDPRILIGILIVAVSVLLGVKVLAGADDTVGVWAARSELPAGTTVGSGDLTRVEVRFSDGDLADRYLSADRPLPRGGVLDRAVAAGEMLPRAALGSSGDAVDEVPLSVAADDFPATVHQGSRVDVWVTPQTATTADKLADATRVLEDVVVVQVPKSVDSLAPNGTRQVIVGVSPATSDDLGSALGRTAQGRVVITRRG